jgi:hypothetical protein
MFCSKMGADVKLLSTTTTCDCARVLTGKMLARKVAAPRREVFSTIANELGEWRGQGIYRCVPQSFGFVTQMPGGFRCTGDDAAAGIYHQHAARKAFLQQTRRTSAWKSAFFPN